MNKDTFVATILWASVGFALLYTMNLPAPRYNPLDGSWAMAFGPEVPSMGWYGRLGWGIIGGVCAGAFRAIAGRLGLGPRIPLAESGASIVAISLCALWIIYAEWQHWIAT